MKSMFLFCSQASRWRVTGSPWLNTLDASQPASLLWSMSTLISCTSAGLKEKKQIFTVRCAWVAQHSRRLQPVSRPAALLAAFCPFVFVCFCGGVWWRRTINSCFQLRLQAVPWILWSTFSHQVSGMFLIQIMSFLPPGSKCCFLSMSD